MVLRLVNSSLLALILLLLITGGYGIIWRLEGWIYDAHRIAAWALIALLPWKTAISMRSLRRGIKPNFDRGIIPIVSLLLAGATIGVILLGLMWTWRFGPTTLWLRQTVISWHWILALIIMPPFVLHAWRRWPRPKKAEFTSRGNLLKFLGLGAIGFLGWQMSKLFAVFREDDEAPRNRSGSRLSGYLSGNNFPVTNSAGDGREPINLDQWNLTISGAVKQPLRLSYFEILAISSTSQIATLDCTVGWYSVQRWRGLALKDLLDLAEIDQRSWLVQFRAQEGYQHSLTLAEASDVVLATHVGGAALSHVHGFPLRAVVPSRRGWFWVKWLSEIRIS